MYKLVAVAGKIRGQEFQLKEGENVIGRDSSCDIKLSYDGISKKHLQLVVSNEDVKAEDLGSSNGTFINGQLTKRKKLKSGDKVALPNVIFQVVYVREKVVSVAKDENDNGEENSLDNETPPLPKSLPGKFIHLFKYKVMPVLYTFNKEYEWRSMLAVLCVIFLLLTVALTVFPVLKDSKRLLLYEISKRGGHYADEIARLNNKALEQKNLDRLDTNFLENEDGVVSYELFDLEGRIVRPLGKLNQFINDPFSVNAKSWAENTKEFNSDQTYKKFLDNGEIGIAKVIQTYNPRLAREESVGIIAIRFAPRSLVVEAANNSKAYLEAITSSALVALLFFGMFYYLTIKPLTEMKNQIELVLRGKLKQVELPYLMSELTPLKNTVNSILQINRDLSNEETNDFLEEEDDGNYVTQLQEFAKGAQGAIIILNSQKNLVRINTEGEDLTGIRESSGLGMGLLDIARDQGMAATIIDLCDQSANESGAHKESLYEITGRDYLINVVSLIGKDSFAKAFYITFRGAS